MKSGNRTRLTGLPFFYLPKTNNMCKTFQLFLVFLYTSNLIIAQSDSSLPSGYGISKSFPNDKEITTQEEVLFYDGFEESSWMEKWDQTWANVGEHKVTVDSKKAYSGNNAYKTVIFRPNKQASSVGIRKFFDEEYDCLFFRYYAKYDDNPELFHGGTHNAGSISARLPDEKHQSFAGVYPNGENLFTVLLDTWRPDNSVKAPGHVAFYCYHLDQGHQWGDHFFPSGKVLPGGRELFGDSFIPREDFIPEAGKWYCYEMMVKTNIPGKRDGRVAFWIDGKLIGDFENIRFRTTEKLKPNRVGFGLYTHNDKINKNITMWFDDVVVATSYIGPIFKPEND